MKLDAILTPMKKKILLVLVVSLVALGGLYLYNAISPADLLLSDQVSTATRSEANQNNDCTSYEKYDTSTDECYYECDTDAECADIEKKIDQELATWADDYTAFSNENNDNKNIDTKEAQKTIETKKTALGSTIYKVSTGEKITLDSGIDATQYQNIWRDFARISPDSISDSYIDEYLVYSDSKDDSIAYVADDDGNGKWTLAINLAMYLQDSKKEQSFTLIHELTHIITLNSSQVVVSGGCKTYSTAEGCANQSSYLNQFVTKFWTPDMLRIVAKEKDVYTGRESKFTSEYAATNPEEDIAESFALYVLSQSPTHPKTQFFQNYPALVQIRLDIRSNLGGYARRR